jgi:hypothetical protein
LCIGSREQGAGSREQGAGSREQGAGSREQGAGSREQGAGSREQHKCLTYSTSVVFVKIFILKALGLNRCNLITSVVYAVDNGVKLLEENPLAVATNFLSTVLKYAIYGIFKDGAFFGTLHSNCQLLIVNSC